MSVTCERSVVSPGTPAFSTNKTDCHDITEVFDVALFMLIIWCFFLLSDEFNAAGLTEYKCLVSDYKIHLYSVSNMQEIPDKSHISFCF